MISAQEINKAFQIWYTQYKFKNVERGLEPFLQDSIKPFCLNKIGWLEQARNSLFLSGYTVAEKLNISRAAYAKYEEDFDERLDPHGKKYYWLTGEFVNFDKGKDTDVWALQHNYASVVPVQFDLTNYTLKKQLEKSKIFK